MGSVINNRRLGGERTTYATSYNGVTVVGGIKSYATFDEMRSDQSPAKFAFVSDATGDTTVNRGFAIYVFIRGAWKKLFEEEAMDRDGGLVISTRWENIVGKPSSAVQQIDEAVRASHTHDNAEVLNELSAVNGRLYYNGEPVDSVSKYTRYLQLIRPVDTTHNVSVVVEGFSSPLMSNETRLFIMDSSTPGDANKIRYYGRSDATDSCIFLPVSEDVGIPYAETAGRFVIIDLEDKLTADTIFLRWRWYDATISRIGQEPVSEGACVYPSITPSSSESVGLVWKDLS